MPLPDTVDLALHSLTVAGAAPDLPHTLWLERTGFPFHPVKGTRTRRTGEHGAWLNVNQFASGAGW